MTWMEQNSNVTDRLSDFSVDSCSRFKNEIPEIFLNINENVFCIYCF